MNGLSFFLGLSITALTWHWIHCCPTTLPLSVSTHRDLELSLLPRWSSFEALSTFSICRGRCVVVFRALDLLDLPCVQRLHGLSPFTLRETSQIPSRLPFHRLG